MAAFGIAIITRSETRLAMAAVLWFVLHQKVGGRSDTGVGYLVGSTLGLFD
jgi:hypothetical protein